MKKLVVIIVFFSFGSIYSQCYNQEILDVLFKGRAKYDSGDYRGALVYYKKITDLGGYCQDVNFYIGEAKNNLGDYEGALQAYNKAIKFNDQTEAYHGRGIAKERLGDFKGAINDYIKTLEWPFVESPGFTRGTGKFKLEVYQGAIVLLTKKILQEPKNGRAYHSRGIAYFDSNQLQRACLDFNKAGELGYNGAYSFVNMYCK